MGVLGGVNLNGSIIIGAIIGVPVCTDVARLREAQRVGIPLSIHDIKVEKPDTA